jgi:hypothetical protein
MFVFALELDHATLQRHLLAVQVHDLLRELVAVVGLAAAARRERLGGFALAPLLRGARARHLFAWSLTSVGSTAMSGSSCGSTSSFITSQHRLNVATLSSKSHKMFWRYLVCSSSALYGELAVGTRTI